ncbi:hypothetical protein H5410_012755 [Solanum commersonii]|uniref:Uncharacterized protein n=1 Tax=Solanum commersonii TaxID=4109 RepID=A0A9J6AT88_SOLCO|nr:hypothetical protein H5410_012755 [Solanum commersonii]
MASAWWVAGYNYQNTDFSKYKWNMFDYLEQNFKDPFLEAQMYTMISCIQLIKNNNIRYQSLELPGSCQILLKKPMRAGVHGELGNPSKKHGVCCLLLSFGASGMKGIIDDLMGFQLLTVWSSYIAGSTRPPVTTVELFLDYVCSLVI